MLNEPCLKDCELDRASSTPLHKQMLAKLESRIREKILRPHDRLPTVRQLAEAFHVGPGTVMEALKIMNRDGVIVAKQGSGTFVAPERAGTVAMCFPFGESGHNDPMFVLGQQLIDGLKQGCEREREIRVFGSTEELSEEEIWGICRVGNTIGLVFHGMSPAMLRAMVAVSERMPVVGVLQDPGKEEEGGSVDCVLCDPVQAITIEIEKRIEDGQKDFAYLGMKGTTDVKNRHDTRWVIYDAVRTILNGAGRHLQEFLISWETYLLWEQGNAASDDIPAIPDGAVVIASTPHMAKMLLSLGPSIGMDVISFCSSRYTLETSAPGMTIFYMAIDVVAAEAARHIETLVASGKCSSGERIFLSPDVVVSGGRETKPGFGRS